MSDQMRLANQWNWSTVIFYLWHLTDGLTHLLIESTYVYGCFRNSVPMDEFVLPHQSSCACACASSSFSNSTNSFRPFLGRKDRLHGNEYGTSVFAKLWQEYARADGRYAGVDLTTLSLEIVTVVLAGPLALYVAELGRRDVRSCGHIAGNTCFWATVLAVSELYGGYVDISMREFLWHPLCVNFSIGRDDTDNG